MDKGQFSQAVERLKQVNDVIEKLDPAIRADAFKLLSPYVGAGKIQTPEDPPQDQPGDEDEKQPPPGPDADEDELVERFESDTDSENALLALGIALKRYGRGPYALAAVKGVADALNLDVPKRLDKTFGGLKRDGNELFRKAVGWVEGHTLWREVA